MKSSLEQFEFQTEARQLLDLMIHSVYSNRDIFLRELISNSSDALDKLRIESLRSETISMPAEPRIRIAPNSVERTLTVEDNGIGMNHDELVASIGTIARSGTKEFLQKMSGGERGGADLIGQFGVGFYATFMVADRVTVVTRRAGDETGWRWESTGDGTYTIEAAERIEPGTTVTLHLKPTDQENAVNDYTDEWTIRSIVRKYSDFITWPVQLRTVKPATPNAETPDTAEPVGIVDAEGRVVVWETINSMKAIWRRPQAEITAEEHTEFYHHLTHDWEEPLSVIQFRAEGTQEYYALIYIPKKMPMDLMMREGGRGLHLYVRRVFIMDDARELLPLYLRFLAGVVDSEDLPLNISREILQQNSQVRAMRRRLIAKTFEALRAMRSNDRQKYLGFWQEFGKLVKEGVYNDQENAEEILDLALFTSTTQPEPVTLQEYIERMKDEETMIYYITGESYDVAAASPHLELFREKEYEVLVLTDPVDEVWLSARQEFKGKRFHSVARGLADIGPATEREEREKDRLEKSGEYAPLLADLTERLKDRVREVRLSDRLRSSAVCLVGGEHDVSPGLEKILKAMGQAAPESKRILEINPEHPLLATMWQIYNADTASNDLDTYAQLLYGQAVLAEGGDLPDPASFSRLVADLMVRAAEQTSPSSQ